MAENAFPVSGAWDVPGTPGDFEDADNATQMQLLLLATKHLVGAQGTPPTIEPVAGVLTPIEPISFVDTELSGPSSTVFAINTSNFRDGELCILRCKDATHVVTFSGAIVSPGSIPSNNFVMDDLGKNITLIKQGSVFAEYDRSGVSPLTPHGKEWITSSANWIVPSDVYKAWITIVDGGPGGGGGAGSEAGAGDGANGVLGGSTEFGGLASGSTGNVGTGGKANGLAGEATNLNGSHGLPGNSAGAVGGGRGKQTLLGVYGSGGDGGLGRTGGGSGGSGSGSTSSENDTRKQVTTTPGDTIVVTIGAGGAGGAGGAAGSGGDAGGAGSVGFQGAVLVEW